MDNHPPLNKQKWCGYICSKASLAFNSSAGTTTETILAILGGEIHGGEDQLHFSISISHHDKSTSPKHSHLTGEVLPCPFFSNTNAPPDIQLEMTTPLSPQRTSQDSQTHTHTHTHTHTQYVHPQDQLANY